MNTNNMFGEDDFARKMDELVRPFQEAHYLSGDFPGCDFQKIHYTQIIHPQARAAIVISHGFCEFIGKYDEMIYYFYQMGYSVFFPEHRGHGFSYRSTEDLDKVDAIRFYDYVDDLKCFLDMVVRPNCPNLPLYLYGHSMGGAIAAAFLEEYPGYFKAAILSSPMMQMTLGKFPEWAVRLLAAYKLFRKKGEDYIMGSHGFDGIDIFEKSSSLSRARYEYVMDMRRAVKQYRTYGGTYRWIATSLRAQKKIIKKAGRIQIPVLLFQAGLDYKVQPRGQEKFAQRAQIAIHRYPQSKHEIFNATTEMRKQYYDEIFRFWEQQEN